ncbi:MULTISPECIES: hypothetical protein [Lonsdalea]|nr:MULTISPECIES: hypothetical protein [Lonsdalea]QPQ25504.1 hypothetical protein I6N93_07000 [Lonsdalea populi]
MNSRKLLFPTPVVTACVHIAPLYLPRRQNRGRCLVDEFHPYLYHHMVDTLICCDLSQEARKLVEDNGVARVKA